MTYCCVTTGRWRAQVTEKPGHKAMGVGGAGKSWEERMTPGPVPVEVLNTSLLSVGSALPAGGDCIPKSY